MTVQALRSTARRIQALQAEADELHAQLQQLTRAIAPWLLELFGVGPISAAQLLVSWSHAGRFRSEAAFAALAGTNPIPASSGKIIRHRLNRGGDRQLNQALHTIALVRLRDDPETRPTLPAEPPTARALATSSAASSGSSPGSCSGSWNATTSPASRCSWRLDKT